MVITWARRLKRVFRLDITKCERCEGPVKIIACIEDPAVIEQILRHLRAKEGEQGPPRTWLPPSRAPPGWPVPSDRI